MSAYVVVKLLCMSLALLVSTYSFRVKTIHAQSIHNQCWRRGTHPCMCPFNTPPHPSRMRMPAALRCCAHFHLLRYSSSMASSSAADHIRL